MLCLLPESEEVLQIFYPRMNRMFWAVHRCWTRFYNCNKTCYSKFSLKQQLQYELSRISLIKKKKTMSFGPLDERRKHKTILVYGLNYTLFILKQHYIFIGSRSTQHRLEGSSLNIKDYTLVEYSHASCSRKCSSSFCCCSSTFPLRVTRHMS